MGCEHVDCKNVRRNLRLSSFMVVYEIFPNHGESDFSERLRSFPYRFLIHQHEHEHVHEHAYPIALTFINTLVLLHETEHTREQNKKH